MEGEYSLAMFEDGRTEIIPKSWIQDYLKDDSSDSMKEEDNESDPRILQNQSNYYPGYSEQLEANRTNLYLNNMYKSLEMLKKDVQLNKIAISKLQKSVDRLICIATGEPEPEVELTFPAQTLNEFLAIEEHIQVKTSNYSTLVENLSKIGGKTVESATRKIWNRLCSTELASTICWTGANGKYCLKLMSLNRLVRDAVLNTHPFGKESDIQRATMLWFSHAQDRLRARKPQ